MIAEVIRSFFLSLFKAVQPKSKKEIMEEVVAKSKLKKVCSAVVDHPLLRALGQGLPIG